MLMMTLNLSQTETMESTTAADDTRVNDPSHPARCLLLMLLVMLGASLNLFILIAILPHKGNPLYRICRKAHRNYNFCD